MSIVRKHHWLAEFLCDESGVAMTEAIIVVPFLTLLAVAVLEFGSVFWQREQIQTGLRDATRYMARCNHTPAECETWARNLAYYGNWAGTGSLRAPGWNAANAPITFTKAASGGQDNVTATSRHLVIESPLFGFLGMNEIEVRATHSQRVIGW